jgi:hypothetical protein
MRNPERFARYVAAVRERVEDHHVCCSHLLSFQVLDRALQWYDRAPVTTTMLADRAVIMSMARWDSDYSNPAARAARWIYRGITEVQHAA